MANHFEKVDAIMRSVEDEDNMQRLGIEDYEVQTIVKPIYINIDCVESFNTMIGEDGEGIEDEVNITMKSGAMITLKITIEEFIKLISK